MDTPQDSSPEFRQAALADLDARWEELYQTTAIGAGLGAGIALINAHNAADRAGMAQHRRAIGYTLDELCRSENDLNDDAASMLAEFVKGGTVRVKS